MREMGRGALVLQLDGLQVSYRQKGKLTGVLESLSLQLYKGEVVALLGESGSGKSTLAKALTGLLPPSAQVDRGSLMLHGVGGSSLQLDLTHKKVEWGKLRGRGVAMLFQDAHQALNPTLKIKDHFREVLIYHGLAQKEEQVIQESSNLLEKLHFSDPLRILESYPFELSGGMCQRVCLALVLSLKPTVLIADEPTSALDTVSQREVLDLLRTVQRKLGLTVLLITHDLAVAKAASSRVIVLRKGKVEEEGWTRQVLSSPQAAYTRQLLASRASLTIPSTTNNHGPVKSESKDPLLVIEGLGAGYTTGDRILKDIHLTIMRGEIVGVLGQSGCGKSTLAKCLVGLVQPEQGTMKLRGIDIGAGNRKSRRVLNKSIQLVFQDARGSLNPRRTALELVLEPLYYQRIGSDKREREIRARYYLQEVGITGDMVDRRPPQLSTGQCQRIAIARALVLEPEVLICDEAVSALDMKVQAFIVALLRRLQEQFGFSILMISHDVRVLQGMCHRIAVLGHGVICECKPAHQLLHGSEQPYTRLLLKCAGDLEDGL